VSNAGGKRGVVVAAVVLVVLLALVGGGWALRDAVATSMARDALASRGIQCDDRFAVELSASFGSATVGPTRCTRGGEGIIESIELLGPARVELSGFEPTSVEAESLRIVLRERDVPGGSSWSPELARLYLEQRVAGLVKGLSELSRLGLPTTTIVRGDVRRGTTAMATADRLVLTPAAAGNTDVALQRIVFEAMMGAASLTLSSVTGSATASSVQLRGQATARAGIALLGSVTTGGRFELETSALDTDRPQLRLNAGF
jgi:hypothetical protein